MAAFFSEMIAYLTSEFSKPTLTNLVKEAFGQSFPEIFGKRQVNYVYRYLKDLGAESILLEFDYLDKDYLDDYSQYYVKSFNNGGHKCARLHFFKEKVDHSRLDHILRTGDEEEKVRIQTAYLGFIVLKPLPQTYIGKTCLKLYPSLNVNANQKKCLTKTYNVDLFGIRLSVESVAFQEQDRVVSACATTAIWMALHAFPKRDIRNIPACSTITANALNHAPGSSNSFPNSGLSNVQILRSIDLENLRHHEYKIDHTPENFISAVRYHINSGLPLILGVDVYDANDIYKKAGEHAIAVVGFGESNSIYVHDDRMGPFAKAQLVMCDISEDISWALELQEKDDSGECKPYHEHLVPTTLIIPTPGKARLGYSFAQRTCELIVEEYENSIAQLLIKAGDIKDIKSIKGILTFDIELIEIAKLRQSIIGLQPIPNDKVAQEEKRNFLTGNYARFQWVATFSLANTEAFKICIDATDIPQGDAISFIYTLNREAANAVLTILRKYGEKAAEISERVNTNFFASVIRYLSKGSRSREKFLNQTYGELRAPKYLKVAEITTDPDKENDAVIRIYDFYEGSLDQIYNKVQNGNSTSNVLWAISHDGVLLFGKEIGNKGHPTLTKFKAARIAGELIKVSEGQWIINSKSGRYSGDYSNNKELLENVRKRMTSLFVKSLSEESISCS